MKRFAIAVTAAALGLAACQGPGPKKVGEATLALASQGDDLPAAAEQAPVVEILRGAPVSIPDAPVVKLAIDRQAHWGQVKASLEIMEARGQTPVLLVADRQRVRALRLSDDFDERGIEVTAYATGKLCVRHPKVVEGKCSQSPDPTYIDGAGVRELVREAVRGYEMNDIEIDLPADLEWDDVVRVVDGARTCCGEDVPIRAAVRPPEAFPERIQ
ncbi:hypothetical protein [Haliangium sp.]|uniref:hypothetical protein n=1 Tax=Haliangium sp. TaxID=2663208 RepID=UPI003D10603F